MFSFDHKKIMYLVGLAMLIIFDAGQQYYYLVSFDLMPPGESLSYTYLLRQHFIRWMLLGLFSIPLWFYCKSLLNGADQNHIYLKLTSVSLMVVAISVFAVSIYSIHIRKVEYTSFHLADTVTFFFFQKGLTFTMALLCLNLLAFNHHGMSVIESREVEIKELQLTTNDLEKALKSDKLMQLHARIGNKIHAIALDKIIWIQSDNYCVKIHTENRSYTIRESLKSLENKLKNHGFIRVHRSAIFNQCYLDQVNYKEATIRLKDNSEIPVSRSGIKNLKTRVLS